MTAPERIYLRRPDEGEEFGRKLTDLTGRVEDAWDTPLIAYVRADLVPDPAAIREAALREALVALRGAGAYGRTPTQKAAATEQYMLDRDAILALIKKEPKE